MASPSNPKISSDDEGGGGLAVGGRMGSRGLPSAISAIKLAEMTEEKQVEYALKISLEQGTENHATSTGRLNVSSSSSSDDEEDRRSACEMIGMILLSDQISVESIITRLQITNPLNPSTYERLIRGKTNDDQIIAFRQFLQTQDYQFYSAFLEALEALNFGRTAKKIRKNCGPKWDSKTRKHKYATRPVSEAMGISRGEQKSDVPSSSDKKIEIIAEKSPTAKSRRNVESKKGHHSNESQTQEPSSNAESEDVVSQAPTHSLDPKPHDNDSIESNKERQTMVATHDTDHQKEKNIPIPCTVDVNISFGAGEKKSSNSPSFIHNDSASTRPTPIKGILIAVGGTSAGDKLEIMNPDNPFIPRAVKTIKNMIPVHKHRCELADDHRLLIVGGQCRRTLQILKDTTIIDLRSFSAAPGPPLPRPICLAASAVLNRIIYVSGGTVEESWLSDTATAACHKLIDNDKWQPICSLNIPRTRHTMCSLNGHLYAMGGRDTDGNDLDSVEIYDPDANKWTMHRSKLNESRKNATCLVYRGKIFVSGGEKWIGSERSTEMFDPIEQRWTVGPKLNKARIRHSMAECSGKMYVLGGLSENTIEVFNEEENKWEIVDKKLEDEFQYGDCVAID